MKYSLLVVEKASLQARFYSTCEIFLYLLACESKQWLMIYLQQKSCLAFSLITICVFIIFGLFSQLLSKTHALT